jgi:hypothetical protein
VRDHIFEFAGLAAAEREAGVEVVAGEEELGCSWWAEFAGEVVQGLDWGGAGEGELGAGEGGAGRGEGWHAEVIKILDCRKI